MKLSARNVLKGKIIEVKKGATTAHVRIQLTGAGAVVTSSITNEAVEELRLTVGDEAYAVIKASDVMVARDWRGSHFDTGDRADRSGYLCGTVKDTRKMVDEFRARLHAAQHRVPERASDWDAVEAFAAEIVRGDWQGGLMLNPGDKAPDFTGRDHNGNTVKLSDFRGKTVVLWFYPKADTPGWTAEGCGFRDLKADYEHKNAVILGASFDSVADNKKFAEKFNFNFPLICDTDRTIGTAYGANTDPQKGAARVGVVIDRDGKIKEWHARVDARAWPAEVVKAL